MSSTESTIRVVVKILSNGETEIQAPDGVSVELKYVNAPGDANCVCASVIRRNESGEWFHIDAGDFGDDHDAEPNDAAACGTCGHPVYVDSSDKHGDLLHVDDSDVFEVEHGPHSPSLAS